MSEHYPCIVLIPVGPRYRLEFLNDTLSSVERYIQPPHKIILVDNSLEGIDPGSLATAKSTEVVRRMQPSGVLGELYYNVSLGILHCLARFDFDVLLRLDDDALVIGSGADRQATRYFAEHPTVGCLGSYRLHCMGGRRDFGPPARTLRREISVAGLLHPRRWAALRGLRTKARANGYEDGAHCLAAACFFSRSALLAMKERGMLGRTELISSRLGDDHLLGLLTMAAGFAMDDFATEGRPLALSFRGLPGPPDVLVRMGKAIVHSVKQHEDMDQGAIRAAFRRLTGQAAET